MDTEKKIEKQISAYQQIAKYNKDIDMPALVMNALENQYKNSVSTKQKHWAYLISVALPPFGLIFAIIFYLSDKDDAKRVANICVLLTVLAGAAFFITGYIMFSSSGVSVDQIQQFNPDNLQQLVQ
jgi:hypothetical protein